MDHPAEVYGPSVSTLVKRARFTRAAIGVTIAVRLVDAVAQQIAIAEPGSEAAEAVLGGTATAISLLFWVAGIGFLYWIHRLVRVVRSLDGQALRWKPTDAVWGFVVPILNFWRPYHVLRDVQVVLVRDEIPEPTPQPIRTGEGGYRAMAFESLPPAKPVSNASLGWWWGLWVALSLVTRHSGRRVDLHDADFAVFAQLGVLVDILVFVAGIFAIRVVSSLTARVEERYRRLRHTPAETLQQLGVTLG